MQLPARLLAPLLPLLASLAFAANTPALFEAEAANRAADLELKHTELQGETTSVLIPNKGGALSWEIPLPVSGRYTFSFRYKARSDVAQILRLNGQDWGVGFVRTGEYWGLCTRSFPCVAGLNRLELRSEFGELLVDSLELSKDSEGQPAPALELAALSPRQSLSYANSPRDLSLKLELAGHRLVSTLIDGQPVPATLSTFAPMPDTQRLLLPASALAKLELGEHRIECLMEDGSVAEARLRQEKEPKPAPFSILSVDVGHGKATLLCLPGGETVLVDTGTEEAARHILIPLLKQLGLRRLDHVIITHHHDDHDGGLPLVKQSFEIGRCVDNQQFKTGDRFSLGGLEVLVLNSVDAGTDENSGSLALRWVYGKFSYSDGADNYAVNQQACLRRFPSEIRSDVYYANHHFHGSADVNYLRAVDAALYLVSAQEAVYARGAYMQQFKGEVEPHLRAAGPRYKESLLSHDVGHVLIRIQADGSWTYECHPRGQEACIQAVCPAKP